MKKHNKRQNKHYGQGSQGQHGQSGHSSSSSGPSSSSSYVNCHHGGYNGYDGDGISESSSTEVQYYKSPTKYYYSGTQEDGHDMFDKVLKQIEKSVLKYIKQLENEGKIMLFDTKTQSMYSPPPSHDSDTKKKLKKFNTEVFDPSEGFKSEIYNDINSMVYKGGNSKAKPKNEHHHHHYVSSGPGTGLNRYNNNQQKYGSSSVTSQYYVNEDEFVPSSGTGYDDNYRSSSSTSTSYGDDGCGYSYPHSSSQQQSNSNSQPYPSQDYNSDGYPIMNPYQFVFNQDKYGRHKKDLGSKCGGSYRH